MGRGGKSTYDRKQRRKDDRDNNKGSKSSKNKSVLSPSNNATTAIVTSSTTKSTTRISNAELKKFKKDFKLQKLINSSYKTATALSFDKTEENMILNLIAKLEGIVLPPACSNSNPADLSKRDLDIVNMSSDSSEDEEDDDDDEDSDGNSSSTESRSSDSDESNDSRKDPSSPIKNEAVMEPNEGNIHESSDMVMIDDKCSSSSSSSIVVSAVVNEVGRNAFIRKLVRDDRRYQLQQKLSNQVQPSADRVVSRLRQSVQVKQINPVTTTIDGCDDVVLSLDSKFKVFKASKAPQSNHNMKTITTPKTTIRITIYCDRGKDKGIGKMLVISKSCGLDELIDQIRNKFNVNTSFNSIRLNSTKEVLIDTFDLAALTDDVGLTLFKGNPSSGNHNNNTNNNTKRAITKVEVDEISTSTAAASLKSMNLETDHVDDDIGLAAHTTDGASTGGHEAHELKDVVHEEMEHNVPTYWQPPEAAEEMGMLQRQQDVDLSNNHQSVEERMNKNSAIKGELLRQWKTDRYRSIQLQRESLPIHRVKDDIIHNIENNQVVVISGETGSGKTTQVPLYVLENMILNDRAEDCYILCTQPRRIAAISIAERVHYESAQSGAVGSGLVGYQVRLDSRCSKRTKLIFCTTGVLLRRIQEPHFLKRVSHIVLDEVHERGVETDFLMTILKQQMRDLPSLRVILMSATMQEDMFR